LAPDHTGELTLHPRPLLDFRQPLRSEGEKGIRGKCKGKRDIAVRNTPHHCGNSHAIWDHTVLPAIRQR